MEYAKGWLRLFAKNRSIIPPGSQLEKHGPAHIIPGTENVLSLDRVCCMRCLVWPSQAVDWPRRHRNYGWPDSSTADRVVSNGCDLVGVAHRQCRQHEWMGNNQHTLSFSRAEVVLINSWTPVQQIVYHMLRVFVKAEKSTVGADNPELGTLSNYHIKTLMLWVCELKSLSWWTDDLCLIRICVNLLHTLAVWLTEARCSHYFINDCNLVDKPLDITIAYRMQSTDKVSLTIWFVRNYIRKLCSLDISELFNDNNMRIMLQSFCFSCC